MAANNIVNINSDNFLQEVEKSTLPVLVDFWAAWCGPCKAIAPVLEQLSDKYEGKIKIAKINVDEEPALASKFKIMGIPTLIMFKDGRIFQQLVGLQSSQELEKLFVKAM